MKKLTFVLICLLLSISSQARTITVDDDGLADFNNIQAAINDANNGDTVVVANGIYTGQGNRDIDFLGKAITVRSIDPNDPNIVAATIVDCNGTDQDNHRGFYFVNNEGQDSVLEGLTITNGYIELWGGGGAIYIGAASPIINKCTITNNHAELSDLPGLCYGGGIKIASQGSPLITNCIINDNSAGPLGHGGGIYCGYESNATIRNCLITNNSATGDSSGGGIDCDGNNVTLTNCTIADNSATEWGGGIQIWICDSFTVTNCIIWGNSPNQIDIYAPSNMTITYSDVQDGWTGLGNIDADPCFTDPGSGDYHLKSQAGRWDPNSERWVIDDVTSPAIDAGDHADPIGYEPFPNGGIVNMGAYGRTSEASKSYFGTEPCKTIVAGDINGDCKVDFLDFAFITFHWLEDNSP